MKAPEIRASGSPARAGQGTTAVKSRDMRTNLLASAAFGQDVILSQLPGGLKGEIIMLAKKNGAVSIAVKITNEAGSRGDAHILMFGTPSVFDDAGNRYTEQQNITGVAWCPGPDSNPPTFRLCVGLPRINESVFFPLQGYADIEPGKSVMAHFSVNGGRQSIDKGERFSLAQEIAYRFADFDKDAGTPEAEKLKALHFGTFSFTASSPSRRM